MSLARLFKEATENYVDKRRGSWQLSADTVGTEAISETGQHKLQSLVKLINAIDKLASVNSSNLINFYQEITHLLIKEKIAAQAENIKIIQFERLIKFMQSTCHHLLSTKFSELFADFNLDTDHYLAELRLSLEGELNKDKLVEIHKKLALVEAMHDSMQEVSNSPDYYDLYIESNLPTNSIGLFKKLIRDYDQPSKVDEKTAFPLIQLVRQHHLMLHKQIQPETVGSATMNSRKAELSSEKLNIKQALLNAAEHYLKTRNWNLPEKAKISELSKAARDKSAVLNDLIFASDLFVHEADAYDFQTYIQFYNKILKHLNLQQKNEGYFSHYISSHGLIDLLKFYESAMRNFLLTASEYKVAAGVFFDNLHKTNADYQALQVQPHLYTDEQAAEIRNNYSKNKRHLEQYIARRADENKNYVGDYAAHYFKNVLKDGTPCSNLLSYSQHKSDGHQSIAKLKQLLAPAAETTVSVAASNLGIFTRSDEPKITVVEDYDAKNGHTIQ